jgi:hypothetical protein
MSDELVAERLQSILINTAEGRRSISDDAQYNTLRRQLARRSFSVPSLIATHPSVDSFAAYIRGIRDRRDRVKKVREDFAPLFRAIEGAESPRFDSEAWTGPKRPVEKLKAVQTLLPVARAAVESMISTLSEPNSNAAPPLEEHIEALKNLRELHRTLGALLRAIDKGHFSDDLGQGLAADAARYAKRAARALRDEPVPYAISALLLGVFTACGFPGIGGYMADVALNVTKHVEGN